MVSAEATLGDLDIKEFEIDLLDAGAMSADAPVAGITTVTTSSWICVTVTIVSISATATFGCVEAA
jgi:hypothetical protein